MLKRLRLKLFRLTAGTLFLPVFLSFLVVAVPEPRADNLESLHGKTIRVLIGGRPNGGNDLYARPMIDALKELLPDTTILVQNFPGASGVLALTEAQSAAGSAITLVVINNSPIYAQMIDAKWASFDLAQFHWIGTLTNNQRIAVVPNSLGKSTIGDLKELPRQLVSVTDDAGSPSHVEALVVSALTGLNLRVVTGVDAPQRTAMLLAADADFLLNSYYGLKPLIESGDLVPVLRISRAGYPAEVDDVPVLADVLGSDAPQQLISLLEGLNAMGRMVAAAPATEPALVDALRDAFDRIVADPDLAAEYELRDLVLAPTAGTEVASQVDLALGTGEVRAILKTYLDCGAQISDGLAEACRPE